MSGEKKLDVVVAGHICLDVIPDLTQIALDRPGDFFVPGKLRVAGPAKLSTGGPVSNTGLNLVKLGLNTGLMGKVGKDPFGQMVQLLLKDEWGVTEGMIEDDSVSTSYTIVVTPKGYDRMFVHSPAANKTFRADDVDYDTVAKARLFHLGYPPIMDSLFENDGKELIEIYKRVHEMGITTSLDMCIPDPDTPGGKANWAKIHEELMPYLDIYLPSAEEILYMLEKDRYMEWRSQSDGDLLHMFSGDDMNRLSGKLLDMGGKIVCIKSGYRGYYIRTADEAKLNAMTTARPGDIANFATREFWYPTYNVTTPPNATGSGDSSIAGFYAGYLRGLPVEECVIRATATGARNVMFPDALTGPLPWDELNKVLEDGWQVDPLEVTGDGWRRDPSMECRWLGPNERA